jgi:hypothetical protein
MGKSDRGFARARAARADDRGCQSPSVNSEPPGGGPRGRDLFSTAISLATAAAGTVKNQ